MVEDMGDGGLGSAPQPHSHTSSSSHDCDTPCFTKGEKKMVKKVKRSPNKKKRYKGNERDEVITSSRGKGDSMDKKKRKTYPRLTPSPDDNDGDGSKESEGEPSIIKKKMIQYTETSSLELQKSNLKRGRTPSVSREKELFYLSDKIWGDVNKDHGSISSSCSCFRPYASLDPQPSDDVFLGELRLALTAVIRNQSNPVQVALEQFKLLSQSLSTRQNYGNQILEARITAEKEELSKLEEQKIAMSYLETKIQHTRLVSDAYNASHGFGDGRATDCGLIEDISKAMGEGNCPPTTIGCQKSNTGKGSNTNPHSRERKKKKKRKIDNQGNCCHSIIPSHPVASSKEINESTTSSQIRTLPDGVEVLVKGKPDGKVASWGNEVKICFVAKLRDTGSVVGSQAEGAPFKFNLGNDKMKKELNIGIEGMRIGEMRRITVPPSLGHVSKSTSKSKHSIPPGSWIQYDVELVDVCE